MKLLILDRDGVINQDSDKYIKSSQEWIPIPGSLEAIARCNKAGYRVVVATNQSGLARGLFDYKDLNAMHRKMNDLLAQLGGEVMGVFYCPHAPNDHCACRKPKPGLFTQLAERLHVGLTDVPAVGDSLRDIQAAQRAGARPILVRTGKGDRTLATEGLPKDIAVFDDLASVANTLVNEGY